MAAEIRENQLLTIAGRQRDGDGSWKGDVFRVLRVEAGFVVLKPLCDKYGNPGRGKNMAMALDEWKFVEVSQDYLDALRGSKEEMI